ncbi:MAG: 23S rRNA (pseudouridine(1915)-N(3))-methyltransferase RlmH [Clostridiales bacterium]|jgi:23S rRNA (pseudouridine1915-N3)-methyltransferase|nr:23S rRNA (pseudouridine(1915)-N(3))-methyltransferase RlmH [Clostridiales bacterium]
MKINIICVGKLKESYFTEAFLEYQKRMTPFGELRCIEVAECGRVNTPSEGKTAEGLLILERLEKNKGYTVALDRTGESPDSLAFADMIEAAKIRSGTVNFIIGGSHGLCREVLERADKSISFGNLTYPHQLFRVMLAEQIYRAFMISAGREYHK